MSDNLPIKQLESNMGWWSATILGGDPAYDCRGTYLDVMDLDDEGDSDHFWFATFTMRTYRKKVNDNLPKLLTAARKLEAESYDVGIAGQVLGAMIMEVGAKMPAVVQKFILKCANKDEWATESEERKKYIDDFIAKVTSYPPKGGVIVELACEGLFEKIAEHLAEGKPGLVNK